MLFAELEKLYAKLEDISSGNEIREVLAEFFKATPLEDIKTVTYFTLGKWGPDFVSNTLGLAERSILKAIAQAAGVSEAKARETVKLTGDAGATAEILLDTKPQTLIPIEPLTLRALFERIQQIAAIEGRGAQEKKATLLVTMYQGVSARGAKYLTRILLSTLRLGVGDMAVLDALALAYTGDKVNKKILETAYNRCPDVGEIASRLAHAGLADVQKISIQIGRPIKMMLAQRIVSLDELEKKMPGVVAIEGKYDGERVQIHKDGKIVTLYSRRLENSTAQFPDLVAALLPIKGSFIAEAEIVAIDATGKMLPFQVLMQRRRKTDIDEYIKKIPVQARFFDLLYYKEDVTGLPYETRRKMLDALIHKSATLVMAQAIQTDDVEQINRYFNDVLAAGDEGIMIKALQGTYQAGTRGWHWIKWKKDYVTELSDTFDLVIVGAYYGRGKRSGAFGAVLCAVYNQELDCFETLCKLGTGLTDETLAALPRKLKVVDKKPVRLRIQKEMIPDVWCAPEVVVEVLAAELTKSPHHTAGMALRFPRFLRFRDKAPEDVTSSQELLSF